MTTKTLETIPQKRWVKFGLMPDAPDGRFTIHKIKYAKDPDTGIVWAFIKHPQ